MRHRSPISFVAGFFCFCLAQPAAAGLTYLTQNRLVEAGAEAIDDITTDGGSQFFNAPDFGAFNSVATAYGNVGGSGCASSGFMRSTLGSQAIHASGSHSAFAEVFAEFGSCYAVGASRCNIDFTMDQSGGFTFRGFVEAYDNGGAVVILSGVGGELLSFYAGSNEHIDFNEVAGLSPGNYHLTAETSGYSYGYPFVNEYSFGAFDVAFILNSATGTPSPGGRPVGPVAFPNPFGARTRIDVASTAKEMNLYDLGGRLVRRWTGATSVEWDGKNEEGFELPAGVYFLRTEGVEEAPLKLVRVR